MMKTIPPSQVCFVGILLCVLLSSCSEGSDKDAETVFKSNSAKATNATHQRQDCPGPRISETSSQSQVVTVVLETSLGNIEIELYPIKAPITVANFLAHVDGGHYDGASFYRTVGSNDKPGNEPPPVLGVQGGLLEAYFRSGGDTDNLERSEPPLPPIAHETTRMTSIKNEYGVVGMARREPGTATSEFYINLADNVALDFGENGRNPDGQGYAAFGRVSRGMEIVESIHDLPTDQSTDYGAQAGEIINDPVEFICVYRKSFADN